MALSSITRHAEEGKEQNNGTYPCLGEISFSFTTYRQEIDVHECRSGTAIGEFDVTWVTNGASMGSATAEKSITVISSPVSVRVTKESEVGCDQTVTMKAEVTPAAADRSTISWSIVSGAEFAEFKAGDANLTGIKPGTVKVVAEYKENPSDWYAESVKSPEFTVEVVPAVRITNFPEIVYDQEATMQASGTPKGGTYKEWQIVNGNGDDGTAKIDSESGKIKGTGLGTVTVKVNYEYDGETYESPPYQVKVVPYFKITQVSQVRHGESETMKVEVKPEEGELVGWRILEAKDIITLEESNGKVTGKNLGVEEVVVDYRFGDKKYTSKPHKVEVIPWVTITKHNWLAIGKQNKKQMEAELRPADAELVRWEIVKGEEFITLTPEGEIKGVAVGEAEVKVTYKAPIGDKVVEFSSEPFTVTCKVKKPTIYLWGMDTASKNLHKYIPEEKAYKAYTPGYNVNGGKPTPVIGMKDFTAATGDNLPFQKLGVVVDNVPDKGHVIFRIKEVTNYPGYCPNGNPGGLPATDDTSNKKPPDDFSFDMEVDLRQATVKEGGSGITLNGKPKPSDKNNLTGKAMAEIYCKDYGAHAVIEASVFAKGESRPIATLTLRVPYEGQDETDLEDAEKLATTQMDTLAYAWKKEIYRRRKTYEKRSVAQTSFHPASDGENHTWTWGNNAQQGLYPGDGLSLLDEYRGFIVYDMHTKRPTHVRTDPHYERDLFIYRNKNNANYVEHFKPDSWVNGKPPKTESKQANIILLRDLNVRVHIVTEGMGRIFDPVGRRSNIFEVEVLPVHHPESKQRQRAIWFQRAKSFDGTSVSSHATSVPYYDGRPTNGYPMKAVNLHGRILVNPTSLHHIICLHEVGHAMGLWHQRYWGEGPRFPDSGEVRTNPTFTINPLNASDQRYTSTNELQGYSPNGELMQWDIVRRRNQQWHFNHFSRLLLRFFE